MPSKQVSPGAAAEADRFEVALKSARIPEPLIDGFWDLWVSSPQRAHSLIARFKDSGATPAVTYKAATPDAVQDLALQLASALRAKLGDEQVMTWLRQQIQTVQSGAGGGAGGSLSDTEKAPAARAKTAQPAPPAVPAGKTLIGPLLTKGK